MSDGCRGTSRKFYLPPEIANAPLDLEALGGEPFEINVDFSRPDYAEISEEDAMAVLGMEMTDLQRELDRLAEAGDNAALLVKAGGGLALPRNILPRASVGEREVFKIGEPPTPAEFECIKVTETATLWRIIRDHPGFEEERERDDERRVPRY